MVGRGEMSKFFVGGGDFPIPPIGKTLSKPCQQVFLYNEEAPCTLHTSCPKVAMLLLQDLSTCVSQIYLVYISTSLFSICTTNKCITSIHHEHI